MLKFLCLSIFTVLSLHSEADLPNAAEPRAGEKGSIFPEFVEARSIENLFRLSDRIYSGAAPEGDEGFEWLQKHGIKTIITVDGTKPAVALAHRYGLRYIHLPHGYGGIDAGTQTRLIKAVQISPGPILIHCHHGKYRGPTAAAVVCLATENWKIGEAEAWLQTAGMGTNYPGLIRTVHDFHPPAAGQLQKVSSEFPEVAEISQLADRMVAIDELWSKLAAFARKDSQPPNDPDLDPRAAAVLLWEQFRETERLDQARERGADFVQRLRDAERCGQDLEEQFRIGNAQEEKRRTELNGRMETMRRACSSCHSKYRD